MRIPGNITRDHIISALKETVTINIPQSQAYKRYALKYDGKRYPPRYIISIANKYANGRLLERNKIGSHETNTFLAGLGFEIQDLSTEESDSSSSFYEPVEDKAPELQSYLRKKYSVSIEKAKGFRSGLVLSSGAIIHVSGSKQHVKSGGFYALTFKKYKDLTTRPNVFYAIVLENPDNTFVLPSNKVKDIFNEIDPGDDKEWHYRIRQDNGHYIIRPNNDQRSISEIHYIEGYLNKWDQIKDFKGNYEKPQEQIGKLETQYFLVQVNRLGSENILKNRVYQHEGWKENPRDKDHGKVKPGDILLVYFGNNSIDFKKQIKKVYRVNSVTGDNTRFNLSEIKNLKGISLDTIRSSLQNSILRREVFSKVGQQGFNIIKIDKSDFDQLICQEDRPLVKDIKSCLESFPDYEDEQFIRSAREILSEFLTHFPFRDKPYLIDNLKEDDIYQKENKDNFLNWIQYKTDKIGGVGIKSGDYRESALKNLVKFKQLLKIAVDPSKTLSKKLDAGWNEISGFGGDNILAKKIIYLFNSDRALPIVTEDMEEFLTNFGKDYVDESSKVYGKNYQDVTKGRRYELLCSILLKIKNEINSSWDNITFNHFLYKCVSLRYRKQSRSEPLIFVTGYPNRNLNKSKELGILGWEYNSKLLSADVLGT